VLDNGSLDLTRCMDLLSQRTKLLALIHVSNVLGTINPIKQLIAQAQSYHIPVLIDAAQSIAHLPMDVQDLNCDFLAFSSHKMYGPTGTGVLYAKTKWLEQMSPYQYGGHMIRRVSFEKTEFAGLPDKFEAGTPNIVGVIGMGEAIRFIQRIGFDFIRQHEREVMDYACLQLAKIPGLKILGDTRNKMGVISFIMQQAHAHDVATVLDSCAIAVRAGHHCAMPLMERFKVPATIRISFGIYNQLEDIDRLVQGLERVIDLFGEH
jgi:cysteine desulfurase/selenocysteine lyase